MNTVDRIAKKIWRIGYASAVATAKLSTDKYVFAHRLRHRWEDHQPHIQDAYRAIARWHLEQMKGVAK